jgi:putative tricarboxylic transport membrane protein
VSVQDPESSQAGERAVVGSRTVDAVISVCVFAMALLFAWDSWRSGVSWAPDGPQVGYFPFYLSIIMAVASLYGLVSALITPAAERRAFVTRDQFGRVLQVLIPIVVFCGVTAFLGIYVASFLLVAGFMWGIGRISPWISLLTAAVFTLTMFLTFEIAFNVIMPKGPLEAVLGF